MMKSGTQEHPSATNCRGFSVSSSNVFVEEGNVVVDLFCTGLTAFSSSVVVTTFDFVVGIVSASVEEFKDNVAILVFGVVGCIVVFVVVLGASVVFTFFVLVVVVGSLALVGFSLHCVLHNDEEQEHNPLPQGTPSSVVFVTLFGVMRSTLILKPFETKVKLPLSFGFFGEQLRVVDEEVLQP